MAKPTPEQIDDATKRQQECLDKTMENFRNPEKVPCFVCGKAHPVWNCCESCNTAMHQCPMCGDDLGHEAISACVILLKIEES